MAKEILIADSDKVNQKEFKKIFEATDYNLVFSDSGEQVLLRIKLFKPDLIIAGASLKEKSGLEVCKAVKVDPESKHIPVILFSNVFKEISEEDRKRVRADGIITTPFREDEILNLVDRLMEEEEIRGKKEGIIGREMEWKSIADIGKMNSEKKEEFLLDEVGEAKDEEIIDLVDVVEEPELKMSIQDFVAPGKETPFTEITPLESWEKLIEEEKPADRRSKFGPNEKEREAKGLSLQLGEEVNLRKEGPEKELFEKIDLEEILQKVEQLAPSIEKEWPPEERKRVPEERRSAPEAVLPAEEAPEKFAGLVEFEAALKKGLGTELLEEEAPPFYAEKPKIEIKEELKLETKEEPKLEAPEEFAPTEVSLEEELKAMEEEALKALEGEGLKEFEEEGLKELEEEELKEVQEVEFPESLLEELGEEEIRVIKEPKEERMEIFEEVGAPEVEKEEMRVLGKPEEERIEIFEEIEAPEVLKEEVRVFEKPKEERVELFEEVTAPKVMAPEVTTLEVTAPIVQREEIIPPLRAVEVRMEEVISKGAREMMEGFITKLVPEMTQSIINLTIERIDRMVKEIVPELAEKMIQEEIKRLQKGEKD
jgi:CheY-like chemotaxis protein